MSCLGCQDRCRKVLKLAGFKLLEGVWRHPFNDHEFTDDHDVEIRHMRTTILVTSEQLKGRLKEPETEGADNAST